LEIIQEFTESKSAKKPGREKFAELINKIESGDGVGILAWHPDRLARNSVDGGKIIYFVDTKKIFSLRFPTFWFEPTPQGLFMLQVAFGQSKYYTDNLSENINRGFRQKIRRGEWPTKAPFGYVNNFKTRTIEPHPYHSRIIVRAFEEFATGKYTYESLADFMAELGVETKNRTPLGKASIWRMLSNRAYLGFTKHKGEYFEGSFQPILAPAIFEAVQEVLKRKAKPRKSKQRHDFPLTGLFTCGECGGAITGCFAVGKSGGVFRYYRCTKKKGNCSQGSLQEKYLAGQIKDELHKIAMSDEWTDNMLAEVALWEKEDDQSSKTHLQTQKDKILDVQAKLDKLVNAYLDGEIPKENYLAKKEELLKKKLTLNQNLKSLGQGRVSWIKPLRQWIFDAKRATFAASSGNLSELGQIVRKVGLNPTFSSKTIKLPFLPPWHLTAVTLEKSRLAELQTAEKNFPVSEKNKESSFWCVYVTTV
jgi:site-specific DNA recombinase